MDEYNEIAVSQISLMEIAIKKAIGKLPDSIPGILDLVMQWKANGFTILKLSEGQILQYLSVPFFPDHRDPFDRFMVAVAKEEGMSIISEDKKFLLYNSFVPVL